MEIVLGILMVGIISLFGAIKLQRQFVEVIPCTLMGIMFVLFVFYCVDLLGCGFWLIVALSIVCAVLMIRQCCLTGWKDKKELLLNPGSVTWVILLAVVYIATVDSKALLWDELRLWAAYPKILFYEETLQLGEDALLFPLMRPYFPGMSLLAYFFQKCAIVYKESLTFFVYGMFAVSLLVSGLKHLKRKNYYLIPVFVLIIYLLPTLCFNNESINNYADFYASLYIDPVLGVVWGYLLSLLNDNVYQDGFSFGRFTLTLFTITVLKDSGVSFAIVALIGAIIVFKGFKRTNVVKSVVALLFCLGSFGCWKLLCNIGETESQMSINVGELFDRFFVRSFVQQILFVDIVVADFSDFIAGHSLAFVWLLLMMVLAVIVWLIKRDERKKCVLPIIALHISATLFLIGLYVTCVGRFGKSTPSFPRYVCTLLCGFVIFIFLLLINNLNNLDYSNNLKKFAASILIVTLVIVFPHHTPKGFIEGVAYAEQADSIAPILVNEMGKQNIDEANVYLVCEGWDGYTDYALLHHRIYFRLIGSGYNVKNFWWDALLSVESEEELGQRKETFIALLNEQKCDYVYLAGESPKFAEQYADMLGEEITANSLWKVNRGDTVSFEKLN